MRKNGSLKKLASLWGLRNETPRVTGFSTQGPMQVSQLRPVSQQGLSQRPLRLGMCLIAFLLWLATLGNLQAQKVWSQVSLDRTSAYVGQPVEVRITVYTSTWFTSGIDPGNIKVNGAFTVYFRPVSRSFQQDGQNYAGVELIYHVFPFKNEDVIIPSFEVEVETPPEGDFKGVKRTLNTAEKRIRVKPVPPNFSEAEWLVATGLTVTDNWNGNRQQVKVGDVLERRISRTAFSTVAELIPPIAWDSLPGVSMYPARSNVENNETKTAISATRTETMRYLFEQEGTVTFPEMVFNWYDPNHEKLYKRTLPEVTLVVQPNPDLGVLASIRDSLKVQQAQEAADEAEMEQPFSILGFSPKKFLALAVLAILAVYLLILILRSIIQWIRKRREQYRASEAFFFQQFKGAVRKKDQRDILRTLYRWIDALKLMEPTAHYFAEQFGTPSLLAEIGKLENQLIGDESKVHVDIVEWQKARRNYNHKKSNIVINVNSGWINPNDGKNDHWKG